MDTSAPQQQQPPTASAETPNVCSGEIDRVLRQRRKRHESRSCIPCKRRKVRCDSQTPCATCQKRGHTEICVYEAPRSARRTAPVQTSPRNEGTPGNPARPDSGASALRVPHSVYHERDNRQSSPSQDYSIASIAGEKAQKQTDAEELARDFELDVHGYLRAYTAGEFKSTPISDDWGKERAIGFISLILAVLSSAAHYSDLTGSERSRTCYDLARRSFQALRLANFFFRPTLEVVQTILVLGNMLQNTGQSDAAWAWLGTTARLAQTLHYHAQGSRTNLPEIVKIQARTCWSNIIWQDTLLSMCHARRPLTMINVPGQDLGFQDSELTYHGFMRAICRISTTVLNNDSCYIASVTIDMLEQLDSLHRKTKPYLQDPDRCKSSLEHLQHLALKMHKSFLVTFLCRPEIRNANRSSNQSQEVLSEQQLRIRGRAEENLFEAIKTFLEFRAVSAVPLRSWSMVHAALSSVLLLCIWEETRVKPECRCLREKVIEAFSSPEFNVAGGPASADENSQWLSPRHINALVTLKDAFTTDESGLQVDYNAMPGWNNADLMGQSGFIPGIIDAWDPFAEYALSDFNPSVPCDPGATNMELPAMDPSPTNYLDFIMRG
ncbi:uncharacterized protein FPRO_07458 [Fusarium proliferatum ET1]|uniref:Zn(2)-C6 fungal-type domain-containing protein n=1 Tax=Fusarium proliferatum (strain ET1) TaxID=1227346 RepID=A0A1L7VUZ8_FUSPR|nr:uncharacterized protein FPRO_07458 [Fusarium proliferatum ET1]CZR43625.1 uncharacterized protein FPRO_07458 [Fusarium proliferatum ET1]